MKVLIKKTNELKEVSAGYAVNYLIPKGLAVIATSEVLSKRTKEQESQQARMVEKEQQLDQVAKKLQAKKIVLKAKANTQGELFGGINKGQIRRAINVKAPLDIKLNRPLKTLGTHKVAIKIGVRVVEILVIIEPS